MTARRLNRLSLPIGCLLAIGVFSPLAAQNAPDPRSGPLRARIESIIGREPFRRVQWGIAVMDTRTGEVVYARNADKPFLPASTLKLVVTAAAANLLDPDFRYQTTLLARGPVQDGVLRGDLVIHGTGDPTISGRYHGDRMTAVLEALADSLMRKGVRRIEGGLVVDESHWDEEYVHTDWEGYDALWWYAAPVTPLAFNDNSIDFRVEPGGVGQPARITWQPRTSYFAFRNTTITVPAGRQKTLDFDRVPGTDTIIAYGQIPAHAEPRTEYFAVREPAIYAATVLREVLEAKGIAVANDNVVITQAEVTGATPLVVQRSPRLDSIISPIIQRSQNWFAEQLIKTMGREKSGQGSWNAGLGLERAFLTDVVGLGASEFELRDASGLSSRNRITPLGLAKLLRFIHSSPRQAMVRNALPVAAAETGSLRARLTELRGRVRAKTGSIKNVTTLAGFVSTASGRELAFVILANDTRLPTERTSEAIDDVVRAIAALP